VRVRVLAASFTLAMAAAVPARARIPDMRELPGTRFELDGQLGGQALWATRDNAGDVAQWLRAIEARFAVTGASEPGQIVRRTARLNLVGGGAPGGALYSADALAGLVFGSRWIPSPWSVGEPRGVRLSIAAGAGVNGLSGVVPPGLVLPLEVSGSTEIVRFSFHKGFRFELSGRAEWVVAGRDRALGGGGRADLVWYQLVDDSWPRVEIRLGVMARRFAGVTYAGGVLAIAFGGAAFFPCEPSGPC